MFVRFASSVPLKPSEIGYNPTVKEASNLTIAGIMDVVYLVAGIVAVIVIVIAGFIFMTSRGDAGKVAQAKQAVLYAVIGLVVVMMAFVFTQFILGKV